MKSKKNLHVKEIYSFENRTKLDLPLYDAKISAGFPSPAEDYIDKKLDLNEYLIQHQAATFFVRVEGHSMIEAGIHSGDILIVDRALEPVDNKVVIALLDGEFTVKRIKKIKNKFYLVPGNEEFASIEVTPFVDEVNTSPSSLVLMSAANDRPSSFVFFDSLVHCLLRTAYSLHLTDYRLFTTGISFQFVVYCGVNFFLIIFQGFLIPELKYFTVSFPHL